MSWSFGSVTLSEPGNWPRSVIIIGPRKLKTIPIPGGSPFVIDLGRNVKTLRFQGVLCKSEGSKSPKEIKDDLITQFDGSQPITISSPTGEYDGQYYISRYQFTEEGGKPDQYAYRIEAYKT